MFAVYDLLFIYKLAIPSCFFAFTQFKVYSISIMLGALFFSS